MMRRNTATSNGDSGFTLVEILIVIVILGILATVTVVSVRAITDRGERNSCESDRDIMATAAESYFAREGGLTIPVSDPAVVGVTGLTPEDTLWQLEYITKPSIRFNIEPDGMVVVQAGSGCSLPPTTT